MLPDEDYVTIQEVAKHFRRSIKTIWRWIDEKDFPPPKFQLGKTTLFEREAVIKFIKKNEFEEKL